MNNKSILVVDDELDLLIMIKSIFVRAGYTQIITGSSVEEVLKTISKKIPDIIILDVMMPGMEGVESLK